MEESDIQVPHPFPYTEEDIEQIVEKCKTFPTCDGNSIHCKDFTLLAKAMRFLRSSEQIQVFADYFLKYLGGRLGLDEMKQLLRDHSSPSGFAGWFAKKFDLNNDGIISKEEFEAVYGLASFQWPQVAGKTYEDFLREADTDKSGDVDIGECTAWLAANTK